MGWNGGNPSFNQFRMNGMGPALRKSSRSRRWGIAVISLDLTDSPEVSSLSDRAPSGKPAGNGSGSRRRNPRPRVSCGGYSVGQAAVVYSDGNAAAAPGGPPENQGGFL